MSIKYVYLKINTERILAKANSASYNSIIAADFSISTRNAFFSPKSKTIKHEVKWINYTIIHTCRGGGDFFAKFKKMDFEYKRLA